MFDNISLALWIAAPLVGLFGMFSGGYWGIGCGWLIVPVMLMLGLSPMEAAGISLLQMVPSTLPTVIRTSGELSWAENGLGRVILLPMSAGALAASFSGVAINQWMYEKTGSSGLMLLFSAVMTFIGLQTAFGKGTSGRTTRSRFPRKQALPALIAGLATGVFSSVLGIGGAVLIRPILASGFKVSEHETSVSIRIMLLVTTFFGGASYLFKNDVPQWRILILTVLISIGGCISFPLGVRLHDRVVLNGYARHIHKSFAVIAVIILTGTILKLCGHRELNAPVMILCSLLLLAYLLCFGYYTSRHPKQPE